MLSSSRRLQRRLACKSRQATRVAHITQPPPTTNQCSRANTRCQCKTLVALSLRERKAVGAHAALASRGARGLPDARCRLSLLFRRVHARLIAQGHAARLLVAGEDF